MMKRNGFTLIELVLVIAILGIISVGFVGFINIGSNVYENVSGRDALISDARFSVERLNRELRNALPNSIRITDDGTNYCLEFIPIKTSHIYTNIAADGDPAIDEISVIKASVTYTNEDEDRVVVYPIDLNDGYDLALNKAAQIDEVDTSGNVWLIDLLGTTGISFASDSPNERLFIVDQPVSYCINEGSGQMHRSTDYDFNDSPTVVSGGVLMAENLDVSSTLPFAFDQKLQSDAIVQVNLTFVRNGETVFFSNGVHITNVP